MILFFSLLVVTEDAVFTLKNASLVSRYDPIQYVLLLAKSCLFINGARGQ